MRRLQSADDYDSCASKRQFQHLASAQRQSASDDYAHTIQRARCQSRMPAARQSSLLHFACCCTDRPRCTTPDFLVEAASQQSVVGNKDLKKVPASQPAVPSRRAQQEFAGFSCLLDTAPRRKAPPCRRRFYRPPLNCRFEAMPIVPHDI